VTRKHLEISQQKQGLKNVVQALPRTAELMIRNNADFFYAKIEDETVH
jgi:hypothetical protein